MKFQFLILKSPTAQIYYRRFCYEKKLAIEWQLVRSKVRNMRMSYTRTKSTLDALGDDIESGNLVFLICLVLNFYEIYFSMIHFLGNQAIKKCNYYNELDMIFSQLYLESANNAWENSKMRFNKSSIADTDDSTAVSERSEIDIVPTSSTAAKRNGDLNRTSASDFIKTEESICVSEPSLFSVMEDDIDIDVNTRNKEISIEERKLALEEKKLLLQEMKLNSDEKVKIYKINSREKLKIIEMEMHERLALEEMKLKYK